MFAANDPGIIHESLWVRHRHEKNKLTMLGELLLTVEAECQTALHTAMDRTMKRVAVLKIAHERKMASAAAAMDVSRTKHRHTAALLYRELTSAEPDNDKVAAIARDVRSSGVPPALLYPQERWLAFTAVRISALHDRKELETGPLLAMRALAEKYHALPISCWTEDRELDFREELDHALPIDFMPL